MTGRYAPPWAPADCGINCSSFSLSFSLSPLPLAFHPLPCVCHFTGSLASSLPCVSLDTFPLTWSLGAASVSPAPATVLFPCCAHGAAPLAYSGPGLLCCPCVLEQKQTGSMDSDDFRALLISTGYSLVCSLCLPLAAVPLLLLPPLLAQPPPPPHRLLGDTPPAEPPPPPPVLLLLGGGLSDDPKSPTSFPGSLLREEVRPLAPSPFSFSFSLSFFPTLQS